MTIGFHSPLPPARTGVADYSVLLIDALREAGATVVANPPEECDRELYHIGNNPLHAAIYDRALRRPGAVVLHDAMLHHFHLGRMSREQYVEEFVYNYGEWNRSLAQELWKARSRSGQDERYFAYPMLRRLMERSRVVIVHNPAAAAIAEAHGARNVVEIPHLKEPPPEVPLAEAYELRSQWGVGPQECLFGVFGYLRESKRLMPVLKAVTLVGAPLLLAGECVSRDLERTIEAALRDRNLRVIRKPFLPEQDFWRHAAAVDVCINLRYPSAGETSGIAMRLMSLGKPVIVTAGEEYARFPKDIPTRIGSGLEEDETLAATIMALAGDRMSVRAAGTAAREYLVRHHTAQKAAALYLKALVDYN